MRPVAAQMCLGALIALVACGCAPARTTTGAPPQPGSPTSTSIPATVSVRSTTTTVPVEQPGWTTVSRGTRGVIVDERTFAFPDGAHVIVARFRVGQTRFALHVGSQDPPVNRLSVPPGAGATVAGTERPNLLAAFNGGFKMASGSGGFEVDGRILRAMSIGAASFAVDSNGTGHVGVWGQDLPRPGEQIASVRQNLVPLVRSARLSADINQIRAWGSTYKGESMVARSGLGEDTRGNILYAASMTALPIDVGTALIDAGATSAMQLDINPEWVQLAVSAHPGGPLFPGVPGQHRPADQYIVGWTRDFVTVLTTG